LKSYRTGP
jgi:hypothetical protein